MPTAFNILRPQSSASVASTDWTDEQVWKACNPALGIFRNIEEMRQHCERAKQMPAAENTFRRLYLNQWVQQVTRWIDLGLWDENAGIVQEDALRGRTCYGGLDLGSVSDLTAWAMIFPHEDDPETVDVLARFWCPETRLHDTANPYRDSYQVWKRQGWLQTTPGEATDYAFVKAQILKDAAAFKLVDLNVDRLFQAHQLATELTDEGLKIAGFGMGFLSMAVPMRDFMHRLLGRKLRHGPGRTGRVRFRPGRQ